MYFQALTVIHLGNCQMTQTVNVSDDLNNGSSSEPVLAVVLYRNRPSPGGCKFSDATKKSH